MNKFKTRYPSQILTAMLLLSSMACAAEDLNDGLTEEEALAEAMRLSSLIAQPAPAPIAHQDVDLSEEEQLQIALAMSETEAPRPSPAAAARPAPQRDPFVDFYAPYVPPADPFPPAAAPKPAPAVAKSIIKRQSEIFYFGEVQYPDSPLPKPGEPKPSAAAAAPSSSRRPPAEDIFDFRAPAYPLPATTAPATLDQQEKLKDLARYVLGYRFEMRNRLGDILENRLQFIEHLECFMEDPRPALDENPLEQIKQTTLAAFQVYCENKGIHYETAQPLLQHVFQRYVLENPAINNFLTVYQRLRSIIIDPTSNLGTLIQNTLASHSPESTEALTTGMRQLDLPRHYEALKERLQEINITLKIQITPDVFLATAPRLDLTRLLIPNQAGQTAPVAQEKGKAPEKPQIIDRTHTPLHPSILKFKEELDIVVKEKQVQSLRQKSESVMAYGQAVAPEYYKDLERQIQTIWDLLPAPRLRVQPITKESILEFYKTHLLDIGHTNYHYGIVDTALTQSAPTNSDNDFDINILRDKRPHDYLFMVFSHVQRFDQMVRPHDKDLANNILFKFYSALVEQSTNCQAGMVGRVFMVHQQILINLIDYYDHTPINS